MYFTIDLEGDDPELESPKKVGQTAQDYTVDGKQESHRLGNPKTGAG